MARHLLLPTAVLVALALVLKEGSSRSPPLVSYNDGDSAYYEIVGVEAHSSQENPPVSTAFIHSRRQRRSPHFNKWGGGYGVGAYHGHYQPYYQQHGWNGGSPSSSWSNSHAQSHSVSAQFGDKHWGAGFSGSSASAGSGAGTHNYNGYYHKK